MARRVAPSRLYSGASEMPRQGHCGAVGGVCGSPPCHLCGPLNRIAAGASRGLCGASAGLLMRGLRCYRSLPASATAPPAIRLPGVSPRASIRFAVALLATRQRVRRGWAFGNEDSLFFGQTVGAVSGVGGATFWPLAPCIPSLFTPGSCGKARLADWQAFGK